MTKIMSGKDVQAVHTVKSLLSAEKPKKEEIIFDYDFEEDYTEEEYYEAYPPFNMTGLGEDDMLESMIDLLDKENN